MVTREVEVECLPADIPEEFKMDVSELLIGKQLRAADLPFDPAKVKLLTDPQRVIAHVVTLKKEEEVAPAEAAAVAEVAPAEPEVIKKGKKEVEEGEEGAEPEKAEKPEKTKGKEKEK
jgi:large subunit ribosomal protein L25